jgi:Domain of unknown function (DUF397)
MANHERTVLGWRKSSHSNAGGECVEVAAAPSQVMIRDSKAPDAPYVITTAGGWHSLVGAVKRGTFDL